MQFNLLASVVLFIGLAAGQSAQLPPCSQECFAKAVAMTTCGATEYECQCTTGKDIITQNVSPCLLKSTCTTGDVAAINSAVASICSSAAAKDSTTGGGSSPSGSGASSVAAGTSRAVSAVSSAASSIASAAAAPASGAENIARAGSALVGLSLAAIVAL